jgi:hypothetical protein
MCQETAAKYTKREHTAMEFLILAGKTAAGSAAAVQSKDPGNAGWSEKVGKAFSLR